MNKIIRRIDGSTEGFRFYEGVNDATGEQEWCFPSCTTVIDAVYPKDSYLIQWIREQGLGGQAIFEKAGEEGTEAHIAIDALIQGKEVRTEGMSEKAKRCVQAFLDFCDEMKPEFLKSEEMLANKELGFAGTRDVLIKLNYEKGKTKYQGTYCVDYKTSQSVHDKHRIQNVGYWTCGEPTDKVAILHLGNRTKAGWSFLEYEIEPYLTQLKHFVQTFKLLFPNAKPTIRTYPDFFSLKK